MTFGKTQRIERQNNRNIIEKSNGMIKGRATHTKAVLALRKCIGVVCNVIPIRMNVDIYFVERTWFTN